MFFPAKLEDSRGAHSSWLATRPAKPAFATAGHEVAKPLFVAGEAGIEPANGRFKGACLTAWLLPIEQLVASLAA